MNGVWVLGGVEITPERKIFLRIIPSRDAATLQAIIQQHVLPGSIVITDCLRGYQRLEELGYIHLSVNHSETYVDSQTGACTNTIEGCWNGVKQQIAVRNRTGACENNLLEFIWRRIHHRDLWGGLISALREIHYF